MGADVATSTDTQPESLRDFTPDTVLKRDIFSETISGHLTSDPSVKVVLRRLDGVPWYARPLSQWLARKEAKALRAVQGIAGTPVLIAADKAGILRVWAEGTPLHLAKPSEALWYEDAYRLLADLRERGVCHNDIAKPQNWLMLPDGRCGVIDFQLTRVHRRRGWWFRTAAREDLRHMLKQKRAFAPSLLTAEEKTILANKSLPSKIWMATGKKLYNFVTRRLMNWSDGEGGENRIAEHGPAIRAAYLKAGASEVGFATYAQSAGGVGLYAFVEGGVTAETLPQTDPKADLVQVVPALPRDDAGTVRQELLELVATNRMDEVEHLVGDDLGLKQLMQPIIAQRLNLTDRRLR